VNGRLHSKDFFAFSVKKFLDALRAYKELDNLEVNLPI
jgi:hypothetical protein